MHRELTRKSSGFDDDVGALLNLGREVKHRYSILVVDRQVQEDIKKSFPEFWRFLTNSNKELVDAKDIKLKGVSCLLSVVARSSVETASHANENLDIYVVEVPLPITDYKRNW
jgi:hypothetical protein